MNNSNPTATFLQEAEDLLQQVEAVGLELEAGTGDAERINRLFRAFHTIKGSGAMFGFDAVAKLTHHVETALDLVREGRLLVTPKLITLILKAKDHIEALLATGQSAVLGEADLSLAAEFDGLGSAMPAAATSAPPVKPSVPETSEATYCIKFRPDPGIFTSGLDPACLLNDLRALGQCSVAIRTDAVPALAQLQPDHCHFAWEISLKTKQGLNAIKDVFMFAEDGSELSITPEGNASDAAVATVSAAENTCSTPAAAQPASAPSTATPAKESQPASRTAAPAAPANGSAESARKASSGKDSTVRVPSERLDHLVNLVGELVMNQSRLSQVAATANVANLSGPVEELERLVDELRDNVLGIRMMPIGATFSRFKRLVRDLSVELGKELDLVTEGAETELDKTVLDQLGDPLVHLIRNSIGHGIELPDERVRLGKPRRGTIRLTAAHLGSNVVITITDDGHGIDTEAVRAKAIEKKLIAPDAILSQREILDLIFLPGFSTAKQVTSVSGRGVGMDVVKRQFDALRGQVAISSEAGQGTTLTLTLPLTLAIIDGLLVEIGRDQFIIPMSVVMENVEIHRSERSRHNGRNVIAVRGELVPYVRLRETFASSSHELEIEKIVIARHGNDRVGLVVDRVLGSHQTVIQPLGRFYRNIELLSGSTIMGDGRVALILDLAGLVRMVGEQNSRPNGTILVQDLDRATTTTNKATTAPCLQGASVESSL